MDSKRKNSIWSWLAIALAILLFACLNSCKSIPTEEYPPNPYPVELSQEDWEDLVDAWNNHTIPPEGVSRYK